MKFSLILCTVNRTKELYIFLEHLKKQLYKDFELIVVDQNKDNKINEILAKYTNIFNIVHIYSELGLSRARNKGIALAKGDILCFPDDDCFYPKILLANIKDFFYNNDFDFLMGKTIDYNTKEIVAGKKIYKAMKISKFNFLGSSTTLFVRKKSILYFDENFGLGATFNSGEEEDFVLRLLQKNYIGFYDPNINYVFHPPSDLDFHNIARIKTRSIGLGALIAKHLLSLEGIFYFFKYILIRPFIYILLSLIKMDKKSIKYYCFNYLGICNGFIKYFKVSS